MRAGCARVERQGAASARDAVIQLQPAVMNQRQVVQRLKIVLVHVECATSDAKCIVVSTNSLIDRTEIAMEHRFVRCEPKGALYQFGGGLVTVRPKQ